MCKDLSPGTSKLSGILGNISGKSEREDILSSQPLMEHVHAGV